LPGHRDNKKSGRKPLNLLCELKFCILVKRTRKTLVRAIWAICPGCPG
jgi:hypothetical protein